jgi:hypothetical protein
VNAAYEAAVAGGRHAGLLQNYLGRSAAQIQRGIASYESQIAQHEAKIADPAKYIEGWAKLDPRQQQALLTSKWPGDIQRLAEQRDVLKGILENSK